MMTEPIVDEAGETENCISFQDLKASKLSGYVLNILFNLNKFMASQTHDPFCIHQAPIFEGKEPPQFVALSNLWLSLRMTKKGSSDGISCTYSISGTGVHNNKALQVEAKMWKITESKSGLEEADVLVSADQRGRLAMSVKRLDQSRNRVRESRRPESATPNTSCAHKGTAITRVAFGIYQCQ
ncbi:predicted protein [Arabidopsis lyrata subsp. lyrata]|uniref:Predicted protein n=1 Tax=Arabidopsis lyrata subsp. lyrata TaxID=81972 RepID=D7LPE4_ARALL|nr:predicted protein [Arabidopsis lyrata subsp. lyrata]